MSKFQFYNKKVIFEMYKAYLMSYREKGKVMPGG